MSVPTIAALQLLQTNLSTIAHLAFDRRIWELSRLLSAAIYIAIAAIVLFFSYTIFHYKRRR